MRACILRHTAAGPPSFVRIIHLKQKNLLSRRSYFHNSAASLSSSFGGSKIGTFHDQNKKISVVSVSTLTPDVTSDSITTIPDKKSSSLKALSDLSKFKLSTLVVATTTAGFLSFGAPISYPALASACIGTALCSSSASTFNQVFEVDRDVRMKRTRNRPIPRGIVSPRAAGLIGVGLGATGGGILYVGTDVVTASLGVGNILLYAGAYTYLKPRSEINTWVGAVVGAIPPVMGWTAAGGNLMDIEAMLLGSTLFLWQFPHFFALSWMHRIDYARGGFEMVPCNDPSGDRTSHLIKRYTCYLASIPIISSMAGVTSSMFAIEGVVLNAYAYYVANNFEKERTNANARKVFLTSLWYLPSLMMLFILHSKTWRHEEEEELKDENELMKFLQHHITMIRNKGRELCLHENSTFFSKDQGDKCPIVFGKNKANTVKENGIKVAEVAAESVNVMENKEN